MSKRIRNHKKLKAEKNSPIKVGSFVVGIQGSPYTVTNHKSICKVIHKEKKLLTRNKQAKITKNKYSTMHTRGPFPDIIDSDIIAEIVDIKSKFEERNIGLKYWVNSKYFIKTNKPRW